MGWDQVSILEGNHDTSLVHAIKGSSDYVYGEEFTRELRINNFATRLVAQIDQAFDEADRWQIAPIASVLPRIDTPELTRLRYAPFRGDIYGSPVFGGCLREISPKLSDQQVIWLAGHLLKNCSPNDAIDIRDWRQRPPKLLYSA